MHFKEFLENQLSDTVCHDILPHKFHLVGHVALVHLKTEAVEYAEKIGNSILGFDNRIKSVAVRTGPTKGEKRFPMYKLVAGNPVTVTTHMEHGVKFRLDPLRLTFSGGNVRERIHMPTLVEAGEFVVDMFACVGQFGLHIAKRSKAKVIAVEINPEAYVFLIENIKLNQVENRMTAILGDCRDVHPVEKANRVVMGYLHDTIQYLPNALETLVPEGGWVHMHLAIPEIETQNICNTIDTICNDHEYSSSVGIRKIKHYSPKIIHYVFDIKLEKTQET